MSTKEAGKYTEQNLLSSYRLKVLPSELAFNIKGCTPSPVFASKSKRATFWSLAFYFVLQNTILEWKKECKHMIYKLNAVLF